MLTALFFNLFTSPATAADIQVSVFNQPGLNGSGCSGENENLIGIIDAINGYAVDGTIVDFVDGAGQQTLASQLSSSTFFFMTDMESADPNSSKFLARKCKVRISKLDEQRRSHGYDGHPRYKRCSVFKYYL